MSKKAKDEWRFVKQKLCGSYFYSFVKGHEVNRNGRTMFRFDMQELPVERTKHFLTESEKRAFVKDYNDGLKERIEFHNLKNPKGSVTFKPETFEQIIEEHKQIYL